MEGRQFVLELSLKNNAGVTELPGNFAAFAFLPRAIFRAYNGHRDAFLYRMKALPIVS